ncbi:MAG: hypothetical protein LBP59_18370 [Planctomycetaceae bacterium]|nr:hypothetical protein [Planctomycetaceae bacterium]
MYSTAVERFFDLNRLFVCLSAKCRRDARDPLVSPACGCTQPLMSDFLISTVFLFAFRQSAGETPAILYNIKSRFDSN